MIATKRQQALFNDAYTEIHMAAKHKHTTKGK